MPLRSVPFFNLYIVVLQTQLCQKTALCQNVKHLTATEAASCDTVSAVFIFHWLVDSAPAMWSQSLVSIEREEWPQECRCIDCQAAACIEVVEQDLESCLACNPSDPMFWLSANVAFLIRLHILALCWTDVFAMGKNNNIEKHYINDYMLFDDMSMETENKELIHELSVAGL